MRKIGSTEKKSANEEKFAKSPSLLDDIGQNNFGATVVYMEMPCECVGFFSPNFGSMVYMTIKNKKKKAKTTNKTNQPYNPLNYTSTIKQWKDKGVCVCVFYPD